jgi:hypothetical protein
VSDSSHDALEPEPLPEDSASLEESSKSFLLKVSVARRGTLGAGAPLALGACGSTACEIRLRNEAMSGKRC